MIEMNVSSTPRSEEEFTETAMDCKLSAYIIVSNATVNLDRLNELKTLGLNQSVPLLDRITDQYRQRIEKKVIHINNKESALALKLMSLFRPIILSVFIGPRIEDFTFLRYIVGLKSFVSVEESQFMSFNNRNSIFVRNLMSNRETI